MRKLLFKYSLYSHPEVEISGCDNFEVSRLRRRTPVRPVWLLHLRLRFFGLGFVDQPMKPSGFLVNQWKHRELGVASANHHS
jgi:hypothetical protein